MSAGSGVSGGNLNLKSGAGTMGDGGAVRVGAGDSSDGTSAGGSIDLVAGSSAGAASTGMGGSIGLSGGEGATAEVLLILQPGLEAALCRCKAAEALLVSML